MNPLRKVSFTQLMTYLRCPEHYLFHYVLGFKRLPRKAFKHGFALHETVAYHFDQKKKDKKGIRLSEAKEFFVQAFENAMDEYAQEIADTQEFLPKEYLEKEKQAKVGDLIERGLAGLGAYFKVLSKKIAPDMVEEAFEFSVREGVQMIGRIDLTDAKNIIHELKTTAKTPRAQDIANDAQLAIYQIGFETLTHKLPVEIRKEYIVSGKSGAHIVEFRVAKPVLNKTVVLRYVSAIMDAIEHNVFYCLHPAESWICSKEWCGYFKFHAELRKIGLERFIAKYSQSS